MNSSPRVGFLNQSINVTWQKDFINKLYIAVLEEKTQIIYYLLFTMNKFRLGGKNTKWVLVSVSPIPKKPWRNVWRKVQFQRLLGKKWPCLVYSISSKDSNNPLKKRCGRQKIQTSFTELQEVFNLFKRKLKLKVVWQSTFYLSVWQK